MPSAEKIKTLAAIFFLILGMVFWNTACKKTETPFGIDAPHGVDIPSPTFTPISGNLTVNVQDSGVAVNGVTVWAIEPNGTTLTAVTSSGSTNFKYDYIQVSPGQTFLLEVPTQGNYWNSPVNFNPASGNVFTFASNAPANSDSLPLTGQGPGNPSYPYTALPTNIPLTLVYNQPGNLSVPLIVSALGLPAGWGLSYPTSILGEGVSMTPVSITIPPQSYLEPIIQFAGIDAGGATYVSSNPVTIDRGYTITVQPNFSYTCNCSNGVLTGTFNFVISPPVSILWQGSYTLNFKNIDRGDITYAEQSSPISFTGTGSSSWSYNSNMICTYVEACEITSIGVSINSSLGTYNVTASTPGVSYSFPASSY